MTKPCSRCGKCCTNESCTLSATGDDVKRWIAERRWNILSWAWIFWSRDDEPLAADLWVSEKTGLDAVRCPFVRKDRNRPTYTCTIYETRPEVCRRYTPWAPGTICEDVAP